MMEDKQATEDFFSLIEKDERINNPFDDDEILFKDSSGNIRVVKGSLVETVTKPAPQAVAVKTKERLGQPLDLTKDIAEVTRLSGIHFNDADMEKRFKQIVHSSLRGVRNQLQTKENFMDTLDNGGLGFNSGQADRVVAIIAQHLAKLTDSQRQAVSSQPFADLQAEAQALLSQAQVSAEAKVLQEKPVLVFKPAEPVQIKPVLKKPVVKTQVVPTPKPASIARVVAQTDTTKLKVEDVKFRPKLLGPVEEIGFMGVTDFRRLGGTAEQAIQRIIEKIEVLEEESFTRKTQAISAWKDSPVNRLYLELGDASIENKIPIAAVIAQRQQNREPYLTEEEVDAIIQLNRKLRY